MKILLLAGSIAGVIVLAATALAAGAAGTSRTIRVVEHATTDAVTDTGKKGDSAGDLLTFANVLYNASNKTAVGSDDGWCIRTAVGKSWECAWTSTLAGGQIMVAGPFPRRGPEQARDRRRHRCLRWGAWVDEPAITEQEGHRVRLRVPRLLVQ